MNNEIPKVQPPEKYVLEGTEMKCPKCGGTDDLSRNEYVACNTNIIVDEKGHWDWSGDSEVHWDTSDYRPEQGEAEWKCGTCDIFFDAPNVKSSGEAVHEVQHAEGG